jgi:hypothetical protein
MMHGLDVADSVTRMATHDFGQHLGIAGDEQSCRRLLLASIGAMTVPAVIPRHEKSRCVASAPTMTRFLAARGPE